MFGLMRHFLKEKPASPDHIALADMHIGCVVGFGFLPQKNISGRRLLVTEINSYLFEEDSFVSFRLEHEHADVSVIIADGDAPAETYLAISQRIEERLVSPLFASRHPRGWFALKEGDTIVLNRDILGLPAGWLVSRYHVVMSTKGRLLDGDLRLRKSSSHVGLSRPFDYVLLVDDAHGYALEAEQYEDGSCYVYSTVYRPATDIGQVTRPQSRPAGYGKERSVLAEDRIRHVPPITSPAAPPVAAATITLAASENTTAAKTMIQAAAPAADTVASSRKELAGEQAAAKKIPEPEAAPSALQLVSQQKTPAAGNDSSLVHGKFGRIQPAPGQGAVQPEMLTCDAKLAGRIIDEAQRNQLLLSELIRKVIDLPARVQDTILIPFAMNDAEYGELARRYGLQASDKAGVMQRILEELRLFAGVKN